MPIVAVNIKQFTISPKSISKSSEFTIPTKKSFISGIIYFNFGERLQVAGQTLNKTIISLRLNSMLHRGV